jgi:hypothetical protein
MIRIVIAVDVVPGHEAQWEEQWRMLRETTLPWTQGPLRVYDEVVDSVGDTPDVETADRQ